MRTKKIELSIAIITVLLCLFILENFLAKLFPISDPYEKWKFITTTNQYIKSEYPANYSITTEVETGLPGMDGKSLFSTNNLGFRGDSIVIPKPDNEYRIFIIGGSTTDNFYLDDSLNINFVLQDYLQVHNSSKYLIKVYNAGKSGDASDDHISMLVHRIIHLNPDMIILFCGINDLTKSIYNFDYLHYISTESKRISMYKGLATEFQIPRRLYYLLKRIVPDNKSIVERITYKSNYKQKVSLTKSYPITTEKPKLNLSAYRNNLLTIAGILNSHKTSLLFMTQQTTWDSQIDNNISDWHWMTLRNGKRFSEKNLHYAMDTLNNVMREISASHSVPIYDLALEIPKTRDYFYDDVHFNKKGAFISAVDLGNYIIKEKLIKSP